MNRIAILLIFLSYTLSYGQLENRWQPDSIYKSKKIKRIYVYENSPKDLSEIVDVDKHGKIIRIEKYSASYNRRMRKSKKLSRISHNIYGLNEKILQQVDTIVYQHTNAVNTEKIIYYYEDGLLTTSKKFRGDFIKPESETTYFYNPLTSTTIIKVDLLIIYKKTKVYDKDFYVNRFYGYVLEPRLKKRPITINGVTEIMSYSDKADRQRFDENENIQNTFNDQGQLIKSEIKSVFMNDRVQEYTLNYNYNKNDLLESITGYVPLYFKYEYFE